MSRFIAALKTDVRIQYRNKLYALSVVASVFIAVATGLLAGAQHLALAIAPVLLLFAGGSTLMYVAALIIFEKEEGTLQALTVTPLRPWQYLWSKIVSLTALVTFETGLVVVGAMMVVSRSGTPAKPHIPTLLLGTLSLGVLFTLIGIIIVVRYEKITDFLLPMAALAGALQIPFLYFLEVVQHPILLIVPTTAPAMIVKGAYFPLAPWEWVYGVGYTSALLVGLTAWAFAAFNKHILRGGQ